jgi:hypothetical protein
VDVHVVIYYDNINIILLVNNLVYHARAKHIEAHYHFVKKKVLIREILTLLVLILNIRLLTFS